jgi:hypothetical protein
LSRDEVKSSLLNGVNKSYRSSRVPSSLKFLF